MPESDAIVRKWAVAHIKHRLNAAKTILDIGVGSGFYGQTLRAIFPEAYISGIEVWPKYIQNQLDYYNEILLGDARKLDLLRHYPNQDLVVAADVVEHFSKEDAIRIVKDIKCITKNIIVTMPIIPYPQGAYNGNVYETHLYDWTPYDVAQCLELDLVQDCGVCGLFYWSKD